MKVNQFSWIVLLFGTISHKILPSWSLTRTKSALLKLSRKLFCFFFPSEMSYPGLTYADQARETAYKVIPQLLHPWHQIITLTRPTSARTRNAWAPTLDLLGGEGLDVLPRSQSPCVFPRNCGRIRLLC